MTFFLKSPDKRKRGCIPFDCFVQDGCLRRGREPNSHTHTHTPNDYRGKIDRFHCSLQGVEQISECVCVCVRLVLQHRSCLTVVSSKGWVEKGRNGDRTGRRCAKRGFH